MKGPKYTNWELSRSLPRGSSQARGGVFVFLMPHFVSTYNITFVNRPKGDNFTLNHSHRPVWQLQLHWLLIPRLRCPTFFQAEVCPRVITRIIFPQFCKPDKTPCRLPLAATLPTHCRTCPLRVHTISIPALRKTPLKATETWVQPSWCPGQ